MRCPKCGYLGFEHVERCRNCGYDFSLTAPASLPELAIRDTGHHEIAPLDDLLLDAPPDLASSPDALRAVAAHRARSAVESAELSLFGAPTSEDGPLITKPSRPRQPLAVRRSTPEVARLRTEARPVFLDLPLPDLDDPSPAVRPVTLDSAARRDETVPATPEAPAAGLSQRVLAGTIDVLVLLGVDLVVVYFTMKISGFAVTDLHRLAWPPLLAYLTLQDATYFVALTAGGQTLGKMVAGIRVVASGTTTAPDLSRAALRTLIWLAMAAPAGLGFLSVFFDADHRGLHDRLSGTRVVRAGL